MIASQESMTAKLCSFARAYHSLLGKDKIFDDYLAYDIIGKDEYDKIGRLVAGDAAEDAAVYGFESLKPFARLNRCFTPVALSRTAFAEQALARFSRRLSGCQYVICGAGMDTFAFRNTDETIRVFELDRPDMQAYKLARIQALRWEIPPHVRYAPIDFETQDIGRVLLASGFRPYEPTFFSLLGVAYYLTLDALRHLVRSIGAIAAPGSRFALDFPDETTFAEGSSSRVRCLAEMTEKLGEPMRQGVSLAALRGILSDEGFVIRRHEGPEAIQRHFFEERPDRQQAMENIHFLLAEKR